MEKIRKTANYSHLSNQISRRVAKKIANQLAGKLGLTPEQILSLPQDKNDLLIPLSIFSNTKLSGLELICKYLKEELKIHLPEIATLIGRNYKTIWATYAEATKKQTEPLAISNSEYYIPVSILADEKLSVLESIVSYLKDSLGLRFTEISSELHRDQRNIWTVYKRAKKKNLENAKD
jgi:hypothetical protein